MSFKLLVRHFVLTTSFTPFINVYRSFYKLVTFLTVRIFKQYPEINAVYLRRGGAKKEIIPLISDIDFAVIINNINEEDKNELINKYNKLAQVTTLLDKTLEIYDEKIFSSPTESKPQHKLPNIYEINHYLQYRFMEGKKTWKRLYGNDYLSELPQLPIEKMYGGFFTEIKVWWTIFEWRFFQDRKYSNEYVTINNACFKAVSEILKMNLALNKDILEFNRKKALKLSKHSFTGEELHLLEKLENLSKKNFRLKYPNILNETKNFLLNYLNRFYKEFLDHPYSRQLGEKIQKVVCPNNEFLLNEENKEHILRLVKFVKTNWQYTCKGSYLIPSLYFNIDEFLLMIEINPNKIPSVEEITELNLFHWKANPKLKSRVKLFLLFPNAAFQIDTDEFNKSWQSILFPPSNPDAFELLSMDEFKLDGKSYQPVKFPVWTQPVNHFIHEEKKLFYELLENPSVYKLNNLDFLRIFWKTIQLVIVNRSAEKEEIIYPFTLPSIQKVLIKENISFFDELETFAEAYKNELNEKSDNISLLIPEAINFLKEIK